MDDIEWTREYTRILKDGRTEVLVLETDWDYGTRIKEAYIKEEREAELKKQALERKILDDAYNKAQGKINESMKNDGFVDYMKEKYLDNMNDKSLD